MGERANIGAGTITCNYDGYRKHHTHIGSQTFIGSNTALVAPVKIGDGAYIAAGSVITMEVPAGTLAVARGGKRISVIGRGGSMRSRPCGSGMKVSDGSYAS